MDRFWGYDIVNNEYHPVNAEPLSTFPTRSGSLFLHLKVMFLKVAAVSFIQDLLHEMTLFLVMAMRSIKERTTII